ncbi:MAG: aminomethyl-transferring glycine dehydrogenase subunit GcvPA [Gammaproteobacteria bacterium]|nr:aminomethyl-transferring glycine dehydrogenase subunit GcvPA [Gammaproteobacteria bacterium]
MPFIPHTDTEIREMLEAIGAPSVEALFDEIPAAMRGVRLERVPEGLNEAQVTRLMHERARQDRPMLGFIGAGAYEHHVPAAVWEIATRGEYYSAYTPYQAEASQGTLQVIYEYQSMMTALTAMDVSNASLYDGASALAEAVLMAVRANHKSKARRILMPRTVHPSYRKTARTLAGHQGIVIEEVDFDPAGGHTPREAFEARDGGDVTAVVIQQPNFFGVLEDVDALTEWAHAQDAVVIAVVNPTTLAVLNPPGEWNGEGADIAVGEGQPLGVSLCSGGPYYGFMCCRQSFVRQMPGRLVGRTVDADGKEGFTLTLQAREQHIRRSKATSNICTNQGLMVTASTMYMALLGAEGLERVAAASHAGTRALVERLTALDGVELLFDRPYFHEAALRVPRPADELIAGLLEHDIVAGYGLGTEYPRLGNALLVCVTETKSEADLERYAKALKSVL